MKTLKVKKSASTFLFLTLFLVLSKHPVEIAILFGLTYLLRWQAGGLEFHNHYKRLAALTGLWVMGVISYPLVCPIWVLYPFLLLINTTIYFFAPATNQTTVEEELWEQEEKEYGNNGRSPAEKSLENRKRLEQSRQLRRQKKHRSVFIAGVLSLFTVAMHKTPISSLLLVALLAETVSILGVILEALQEEARKM